MHCLVPPSAPPLSSFAASLVRTCALTGAHALTTALFAALLSALALMGSLTAMSVLDVVLSFIDAVHASAADGVQQAS